ncbi:MAG: hypothetical protein GY832_12925 [Chloroflexi bacterium]|nr:hypothetical protein [Chloroflexota bacterium]
MGVILDVMRGSRSKRGAKKRRRRGAESIDMRERKHGYFPKTFVWRGHKYRVRAVERCWTISRRGRGGRVEQHRFRVCCREGTFEVYQNVRHNTWHMQRKVA